MDGGYYHLNPEQYRRDRRKDWLYQRHGYLVLRFLAEDVVDDLEAILNTILDAVALRRDSAPPHEVPARDRNRRPRPAARRRRPRRPARSPT